MTRCFGCVIYKHVKECHYKKDGHDCKGIRKALSGSKKSSHNISSPKFPSFNNVVTLTGKWTKRQDVNFKFIDLIKFIYNTVVGNSGR